MVMSNDRELLLLALFTFVTVSMWITFELVKTVKTTTVTTEVQQIVTPLTPKLDIDVLSTLKKRTFLE